MPQKSWNQPARLPARGPSVGRILGGLLAVVLVGGLMASIVLQPTKRNIEVLAALLFLAIALVARPYKALLFTLLLIPYPAYTSVGTTSMLLVFALVGLVFMKAKQEVLPSPFCRKDVDMAILGWGLMVVLSFYNQPMEAMREARVMLAGFYLSYNFLEPLISFMMDRILSIGTDDSSIQNRSVVLMQAIEAIGDKPFLGHGIAIPLGTFRGNVSKNIHNLYLTLAYTIGIPGLIAFLWFLFRLFRLTWDAMRDVRLPTELRELNLLGNTAIVIFLVDEIKIEYTRQVLSMHTSWTFFAIAFVAWRLADRYRRTA